MISSSERPQFHRQRREFTRNQDRFRPFADDEVLAPDERPVSK